MTTIPYTTVIAVLAWISVLSNLTFIVLYHVLAPWWRSAAGRHLMAFMLALLVALTQATIVSTGWTDSWPRGVRAGSRAVALSCLAIVIIWQIAILLKVQLKRSQT